MITLSVRLVYLLLCILVIVACDANENNLSSSNRKFVIPEDGRLSEKQLLDYITIRQKIKNKLKLREKQKLKSLVSKETNSNRELPYFDEIEKSVAQEAGLSYAEYIWIKDTVISTRTSIWLEQYYELNNKIVSLLDQTLNRYKDTGVPALNEIEQKKMNVYVGEMKGELSDLQHKLSDDSSTKISQHNRDLIIKYIKELESLSY